MSNASLYLQSRDFLILRTLLECRIATSAHLTTLHFDGKREAAKKRLQKLKAAYLIAERKRRAYEPAVLFLTRAGLVLLQKEGVLAEYPSFSLPTLDRRAQVSEITLRHELEVMDVKSAFHSAISKSHTFSITTFSTWPRLHQFEAVRSGHGRNILVKPDGFIRIREQETDGAVSEHTFFLEVDRSTETQDTLVARASCYLDYYRSGGFAVKNGALRSAFKEYPFRVLMVFKTADRRNNTAERLLQGNPPILTQVCLSTLTDMSADPLGPVWIQPKDYRDATRGASFDVERKGRSIAYHPQPERNTLIEARIPKFRLLAD